MDNVVNEGEKFMHNTVNNTTELMSSFYDVSLDSIQFALALTVALAWYSFIKNLFGKLWTERSDKVVAHGVYAIVVTVIFVLIAMIMRKFIGVNPQDKKIMFAVTPVAL